MELINGRTAEEIERGLRVCNTVASGCRECPYDGTCFEHPPEFDALALIERLEAQVPRWINIKDRLPMEKDATEDGLILCVLKNTDGSISEERRAWHWENIVDMADCFTYWMPIPEPPKEDANG